MDAFLRAFNEDGKDFIRSSTKRMKEWHDSEKDVILPSKRTNSKKFLPEERVPIPRVITHFVMNLPATALDFLGITQFVDFNIDAFRGLYRDNEELFQPHTKTPLPMIHVYCFQNPTNANEMILNAIRESLKFEINENELRIHCVRNVSPNKVSTPSSYATNLRTCTVVRFDFQQTWLLQFLEHCHS